jgi:hypothetical protein
MYGLHIDTLLSFTTTVWVINWVHGTATNSWADPFPAIATSFAQYLETVFVV